MTVARCPTCDHPSGRYTEIESHSVERHGLDGGPFEHFTDLYYKCLECGAVDYPCDWEVAVLDGENV